MNIISKLDEYKDFLTTKDLIGLGLFRSHNAAYFARLRGNSPSYIFIGKKILFPKKMVLEFIYENLEDGSIPKLTPQGKEN